MTIFNSLPYTLTNGTTADATQVMADFNQIVNDGNTNAAHNGANSDITSLSALSTPLSVGQGGTGANLGATGGTSQVLQQLTAGAAVTVARLAAVALSDYGVGLWTPTDASGAGLTFTASSANYTKIGNMVFAYCQVSYPVTGNGAQASIGGLPFTVANAGYAQQGLVTFIGKSINGGLAVVAIQNTTTCLFYAGGAALGNSSLSGAQVNVMLIYPFT